MLPDAWPATPGGDLALPVGVDRRQIPQERVHELLGRLACGTVVRDHLEREHRAVVRDADRRDRDDVALLREDGGDLDLRAQLVGFRDGIRGTARRRGSGPFCPAPNCSATV